MTGEPPIRIMSIIPVDGRYDHSLDMFARLPEFQLIGVYANPDQTSVECMSVEWMTDCCDILLIHQQYSRSESSFVSRLVEQHIRFIVIDATSDPEVLARHLEAGASGYTTSEDSAEAIVATVHDVYTGNFQTDPYVADALLRDFRRVSATCTNDNFFLVRPAARRASQSTRLGSARQTTRKCSQRSRRLPRSNAHRKNHHFSRFDIHKDLC